MKTLATFVGFGLGLRPLSRTAAPGLLSTGRPPSVPGRFLGVPSHDLLHALHLPAIVAGALGIGLLCLVPSTLGQTNIEADIMQPENLHNLAPLTGSVRLALWFLAAVILLVLAALIAMRYRMGTNLYKLSSDAHWNADAQADAGEQIDATEVMEACAVFQKKPAPSMEAAPAAPPTEPRREPRVFTPAGGTAWGEPMLKAFLSTCVKANCLGRTWRESAARQVQSSNLPDPREAELIRRLMQRWQEFYVDPDSGVFLDHISAAGKNRVCVIGVIKDKHTITEAAFNAGFVIESVGRYLKNTDLVYQRSPGDYHAPDKNELTAMTPGEKDSLIRITAIPDPWQAMIGGFNAGLAD